MKKLIYTLLLVILPMLVHSQTVTENYIKTTAYQVPVDINNQSNVSEDQKIETVTYFDGLGRPKQSITERFGGNREDHITPVEYDPYGRQTKQWLPFTVSSNNGAYYEGSGGLSLQQETKNYYKSKFPDDFYQGMTGHPEWDNPFTETRYEDSPIGRVLEQGAPGYDWRLGNGGEHTIKYDYQVNDSDNVFKFEVTFVGGDTTNPELNFAGWYPNESLFKKIIKDENWQASDGSNNTVEEFTNKTGQTILKRSFNNGNRHNTYYVYDDFGNLTYVLSPECSDNVRDTNNNNAIIQSVLDDFGYQYTYDGKNRLIEKKLPGKEVEYIVYDILDRPALTQDANLRANNQWLFTKYDDFDRVVYTGIYTGQVGQTRVQIESQILIPQYFSEEKTTTATNIGGTDVYYTNYAYPLQNIEVLTVNYYDQYVDMAGLSVPATIYGTVTATGNELQRLLTVSKTRVLGTSDWITNIIGYDKKGRGIYSASFNSYLNTTDKISSELDFASRATESTTTHDKDANPTITVVDYFTYDHMGRLITHEQIIDNEPAQLIVENSYDELGQLVRKNVGGETLVDDYTDLRGVDVSFEGTVEKTENLNTWNAGIYTKGKIVENTNGGVSGKIITADKAMKLGLYISSPLLVPYDYLHYGILATGTAVNGGYELKYIVNGTEFSTNATYNTGDVLKVEWINNGTEIAFSVGNYAPFHTITSVTPQVTVGKAFFRDYGGIMEEFQIFAPDLDKILQNVDYKYNVRGWLTDINDLPGASLSTDLFHFQISYNDPTNNGNSEALYNGNISQTFWRTTHDDTDTRGYDYHYDHLNRITEANSFKGNGLNNMIDTGIYKVYDISYDLNGNILSLDRFGADDNGNPGIMDDLLYSYSGNKLTSVTEQTSSFLSDEGFVDGYIGPGVDYDYDANGNMIKDRNKGIDTNITYNHLNLPLTITINNGVESGTISYLYDATGVKLQKTFTKSGMTPKITQYAGNFMYDDNETSGTMKLQFFNHPEGYILPVANTESSVKGSSGGVTTYSSYGYVFQFKDHLGNVRLSYQDTDLNGSIDTGANANEIIEESNYYPFGLKQKGYNYDISSNGNALAQQFKYNGKELNDELGLEWYDFGARNYDAAIGRWMNLDPAAQEAPDLTPYRFAGNNPIFYVDPDGFFEFGFKNDEDGNRKLYLVKSNDEDAPDQNLETLMNETGLSKGQLRRMLGGKKALNAFLGGDKGAAVSSFKGRFGKVLQEAERTEALNYDGSDLQGGGNCMNCSDSLAQSGSVQTEGAVHLGSGGAPEYDFEFILGDTYENIDENESRTGDTVRYATDDDPRVTAHSATFLLNNTTKGRQVFYKLDGSSEGTYNVDWESDMRSNNPGFGRPQGRPGDKSAIYRYKKPADPRAKD